MMSRKSSIETVFVYALASIFIVLVLYFGYRGISGLYSAREQSILDTTKLQIKADMSQIAMSYNSVANFQYELPKKYNAICFVDLSVAGWEKEKRDELIRVFPLIADSVESNLTNNAFFVQSINKAATAVGDFSIQSASAGAVELFDIGKIRTCPDSFVCFPKQGNKVRFQATGKGTYVIIGNETGCLSLNMPPVVTPTTDTFIQPDVGDLLSYYEGTHSALVEDDHDEFLNVTWYFGNQELLSETIQNGTETSVVNYYPVCRHHVKIVATDSGGKTGSATFDIDVGLPGNGPPESNLISPPAGTNLQDGKPYNFTVEMNDAEEGPLYYSWHFEDNPADDESGNSGYRPANQPFTSKTPHTVRYVGNEGDIINYIFTVSDAEITCQRSVVVVNI